MLASRAERPIHHAQGFAFRFGRTLTRADPALRRQVNREAPEPMSAFIMFTGNGGETGASVRIGGRLQRSSPRIVGWQRRENSFQHPRATQIQSIEMRQLRIARIGRDRDRQPVGCSGCLSEFAA